MESFDEERLEMLDDLKEFRLSPKQLRILSDKVMKCKRDDNDFKRIGNLRKFWLRHRQGVVSNENFQIQVNNVCKLQPQQQADGNLNAAGGSGSGPAGSVPGASYGGMVSSGEAENTDSNSSEDTELEEGGAGDVGGVNEDVPGLGANEDGDEDDEDNVVDVEVAKFVDDNIHGFLARRKWPINHTSFVRPGDGYWNDDHGDEPPIHSFLSSTSDGLEKAEQRPMPEYLPGNPFKSISSSAFIKQGKLYRRCKKMAASLDGKPFRATNEEILDALEEDGIDLRGKSAEFYVKVVAETRRRHNISRKSDATARAQRQTKKSRAHWPQQQEQEEEDEDEEEEQEESGAEAARKGKKRSRVSSEDIDCDTVAMEAEQISAEDVSGIDEDEDEHDNVDKEINDFVDKHTANDGFLALRKWKGNYKPFDRPGDGYWIDDHADDPPVQSFRPSITAELMNAKQRPAPKYIFSNPYCSEVPKNRFDDQVGLYHRCKKVLVSVDGKEVFRATDEEIKAALKKDGRKSVTADFYVRVVSEALRRHRNALRK